MDRLTFEKQDVIQKAVSSKEGEIKLLKRNISQLREELDLKNIEKEEE